MVKTIITKLAKHLPFKEGEFLLQSPQQFFEERASLVRDHLVTHMQRVLSDEPFRVKTAARFRELFNHLQWTLEGDGRLLAHPLMVEYFYIGLAIEAEHFVPANFPELFELLAEAKELAARTLEARRSLLLRKGGVAVN